MAMQPITRTRIIGNHTNLARAAAIVASAQRASSQILTLSRARRGNGALVVAGPYTGGADSVIDVEVLGGADGVVRATAPVVNGVGNGTLDVQALEPGADPQTLQFTLLDAGKAPVPAMLDFFGVQLAARAVGADGNSVELSVMRNLVYTDLPFATLQTLAAGSSEFDGPEFDWGQPAATGADIPAGALRIAFAGLPTVHRAWKTWAKGKFSYQVDPPLVYTVPSDTRVRAVTGDYTIAVTDGVATETYSAVTMYDFLAQVQARSALLQVLGVVAEDRTPGGQAVTDIPLRTDAHALPVIASASRGTATLQVGAVSPTAATENITVTCMGRGDGGAQTWSVRGGVSGQLPAATTGVPYADGPVEFTVPSIPVAVALGASITGRFGATSRSADEGLPAICFKPLKLGAAAIDKEVTYVYRKRPPAECSCTSAAALPLNLECLGLAPEDGGAMDSVIQTHLIDLMSWRADFLASNLALIAAASTENANLRADLGDVELADACIQILLEALVEVSDNADAILAWEDAVTAFKTEMADFSGLVRPGATDEITPALGIYTQEFARKYAAAMDLCRAKAGILPKSDASSVQGSPCWRDYGDEFWWEDAAGYYLPMFTNRPYVSARRDASGAIVSTREFGVGLVTQCEVRLKEGDQITITIRGTHNAADWSEGDRFVIPLIAAASAPLTGGADGDPTQTWTARSSALGALPDWLYNPAAPTTWSDGPATVALQPGGIPFEVGDAISFAIETGQLRWRRDGGAWTEADIYGAAPLDLGDGLTLQAVAGASPSFLDGDTWQFQAVATYGVARMRQPRDGQAFAWDGAAVTLDIDLGSAQPLELVMLAMHTITAGATVAISGGLATATEWTAPAVVHARVLLAMAGAATARYLRVAITGAGAGGSIGWLWAGQGWQPTVTPSRIERARTYGLSRGRGLNPAAIYRGAGVGGEWAWDLSGGGAVLLGDCADQLIDLLDHAAEQGMEPVALIPDLLAPRDASVAIVDADQIAMDEDLNWQSTGERAVSLTLPMRAVLA